MPGEPTDVIKALQAGIDLKINFTGQLPGEALAIKALDTYDKFRSSLSDEIKARWDAVTIQQIEDAQALWRSIFVNLGLLK